MFMVFIVIIINEGASDMRKADDSSKPPRAPAVRAVFQLLACFKLQSGHVTSHANNLFQHLLIFIFCFKKFIYLFFYLF